ncbi:sensor histidine kinase [Desertivirga arenae]|uniref:sensor histidine kinase n=1 Tax=Desertivirga arenae TaxID=2810309 RepID=UPI001A95D3AA|nr:ATP-binding protein [Pedobacter sp. SYSU D00823]
MKLKTKFLWFSLGVHVLFIFLLIRIYPVNRDLFLLCEASLLIFLAFSVWMYQFISKPFDLISSGIESLKDKDFSTKLNKVGHEEMDGLISVYNLMMDQLREERLKQMEKSLFLEKLIEASPTGIIILDFDGRISSINPTARSIMNVHPEEVQGRVIASLPGKLASSLALLEVNGSKVVILNGIQSFKCQHATFSDRGFTRSFYTIEELTKEIYAREKAAYERVVKMMSHEVNNSIGAINSILNSCLNYQDQLQEDDQNDYSNALQISIARNKNLSSLMSNFAKVVKVPEPELQDLDLLSTLHSVQTLMETEIQKKELNWLWELEQEKLSVHADSRQMEQVFINVIKNAIEASPNRGTIRISTTTNCLMISNTGTNIPPEVSEQLFSPFFSTKKDGQGVGLMLTKEILINHQFRFSLESSGDWTEFKLIFRQPITGA